MPPPELMQWLMRAVVVRPAAPAAEPPARAGVERSGAVAARCRAGPPAIAAGAIVRCLWPDRAAGPGTVEKHRSVPVAPGPQPSAQDPGGFQPVPGAPHLDHGLGPADYGWLPVAAPVRRSSRPARAPAAPVRERPLGDPRPLRLRSAGAAGSADPADSRHPAAHPGNAGQQRAVRPSGSEWIPVRRSSGDGSPGLPAGSAGNRSAGNG